MHHVPRSDASKQVRRLLQPVHRRFAGALPVKARRRDPDLVGQGRLPRLERPISFTEKVNWRIVNDRRPLLAWTCDKRAMKEYAVRTAGDLGIRVPATLWNGSDAHELAGRSFDCDWVIKPNHRSGLVRFGARGATLDDDYLSELDSWMRDDQGALLGEWAYSQARREILLEERIPGAHAPTDYKFFVFHGVAAAIQVDHSRFTGHLRNFYTPDWKPLAIMNRFPVGPGVPPPERLAEMRQIAEALGAPFDFIRVDLYSTPDAVWFGEVTPYPGGGVEPFKPRGVDEWLGSLWHLPGQ